MLDGEIVLFDAEGRQDFDALGQRIHPAKSRIDMLAETDADALHRVRPARRGRRRAARAARRPSGATGSRRIVDKPVDLTPATEDPAEAEPWLQRRRGRDRQAPGRAATAPASASGWSRSSASARSTRSCVGWRPGKEEGTLGSLILGLYDEPASCASSATRPASRRPRSASCRRGWRPYETGQRGMGDPSRWNNERELEWIELRPELVVEVTFDHVSNNRIRHGTKISRWREDKDPRDCTTDQLRSETKLC